MIAALPIMNPDPNVIDWNADVTTTPEQEYRVLLKSLRRAQGFKLFFVQCAPAEGERLIAQVREDLPQKQIDVLPLKAPIDNLYDLVVPYKDQSDVLFISGLEHSLYDYEKERLWSEDGIYRFDAEAEKQRYETGVPRVLSHLNLSRERFQRDFPFCLVFLVPPYALKYLIRRAPDFFDWRSGVLEFVADPQMVEQEAGRIILEGDYQQYLTWTPEDRAQRILEIQAWLEEPHQTPISKVKLLNTQGSLFLASVEYKSALTSYERMVAIKPDLYEALDIRASLLTFLERYEEAIDSFDRQLALNPNSANNWFVRGIALKNLGRYEDAIASYDRAISIKPDNHATWNNRGIALLNLGRYEDAIASYDQAVAIKPDFHEAWHNRSNALVRLEHYEDAIKSYNRTVEIDQDRYEAWRDQGNALLNSGRYEDAIASYDRAITIQPDLHEAWHNRGIALKNLGREDEATESFNKAIVLNPEYGRI